MSTHPSLSAPQMLTPAARRDQLEVHLVRAAPQMDLAPLLEVLHSIGYSAPNIVYRSHPTLLHQPNLVQGIEFRRASADPQASSVTVITLNIGLLAPQSPLPSYVFRDLAAQHGNGLAAFLGLCAHHLLRQVVESQAQLLSFAPQGRAAMARQTLTLLGLTTPSTLHWLFGHAFPELEVEVSRGTQRIALAARQVTFGATHFGDGSAFGAETSLQVPSLQVDLWADGLHSPTGEPWPRVVPARLADWLWPLFSQHSLHVEVDLHIRDASDVLTLGPAAQLGHQPFSHPDRSSSVRRLRIFRGDVGQVTVQARDSRRTDRHNSASGGSA